jgi:hypothetical protein
MEGMIQQDADPNLRLPLVYNSSSSALIAFLKGDGKPCTHTTFLVYKLTASCFKGNLLDQSLNKITYFHHCLLFFADPGLLFSDGKRRIKIFDNASISGFDAVFLMV